MDRHSYLADRLYVGAFIAIAAWAIVAVSFLEGRVDEAMRQDRDISEQIAQEADWIALSHSEVKLQEDANGR